ncbi:Bgt-3857 [Blumeria graminis f. sp. tritici]|uniref:Bgt-3857 n=2 Tax=Blumeria graminis f. sp. tritici TaxID=62690 RepID=A0A381LGK3_BLUGR|nr:hypothetical protein BGT96224_3857 [Blumeria graminis f. sp. tritici 96224]VDB92860.1 Bgt-3857 [Blumeria graminis f. sp. tritici]
MASSFEKSVKGATKFKASPPKSKYIEHILIATHSGEPGVAEVFRALQHRLCDSTWTVVFKSLITVHLMIREGSPDVTLAYLARHRNILAISSFSDVQTQGRNIRHYTNYLSERARSFKDTKCDFVRGAATRLERLTVDKGLLRETESVQHQISALLKCDVLDNEPENEITITVFRMLVLDLLAMFQAMNTGLIKILGHFFEMSRPDAERSLKIYNNFTQQTDLVVQYLSVARQYEHQTRVEVPKLKHAPTNLGKQLDDYLLDPEFEANRRQYLAEQESKKSKNNGNGPNKIITKIEPPTQVAMSRTFPETTRDNATKPTKIPDADLIDFFESIEQKQEPIASKSIGQPEATNFKSADMFQAHYYGQLQNNGFVSQQNSFQTPNPFQQLYDATSFSNNQVSSNIQTNLRNSSYTGFTPQPSFQPSNLTPIPQHIAVNFQSQVSQPQAVIPQPVEMQSTNPFRQSMKLNANNITGILNPSSQGTSPIHGKSTNPFAKPVNGSTQIFPQVTGQNFQPTPPQQQSHTGFSMQPLVTGTSNPFSNRLDPATSDSRLGSQTGEGVTHPTGNTNPFRSSQFTNSIGGIGWQNNQLPIGGGLDSLETVPVFPRSVQPQTWQ